MTFVNSVLEEVIVLLIQFILVCFLSQIIKSLRDCGFNLDVFWELKIDLYHVHISLLSLKIDFKVITRLKLSSSHSHVCRHLVPIQRVQVLSLIEVLGKTADSTYLNGALDHFSRVSLILLFLFYQHIQAKGQYL